jgi:CHAT domain-containing protein
MAANIVEEFIKMGVRAVIAAGWSIDDAAASYFARTFYRHLLEGRAFGKAVLEARRATFAQHPETNTWSAYQCYGDPQFVLSLNRRINA